MVSFEFECIMKQMSRQNRKYLYTKFENMGIGFARSFLHELMLRALSDVSRK